MFKNLGNIMQQAKQMKENMAQLEETMHNTFVTGTASGDLVQIVMNCKGDVQSVKLDEKTLTDKEMLESLIIVALRDARKQANDITTDEMKKATGGIDIPAGLLPF
jgi:hypothetical protein